MAAQNFSVHVNSCSSLENCRRNNAIESFESQNVNTLIFFSKVIDNNLLNMCGYIKNPLSSFLLYDSSKLSSVQMYISLLSVGP